MKRTASGLWTWRRLAITKVGGLGLALLASGCTKPPEPVATPPAATPVPVVSAPVAEPARQFSQKVWVLGFDGVDPHWLQTWVKAGKLPHLKQLMEEGTFKPLGSTNPPQSPVAWSSFATGTNPGGHGIYDFIRRDPKTYFPSVGSGDVTQAKFDGTGELTSPASAITFRAGQSFWKYASDHGVQTTALNLPFAFPPEDMPHGAMWSGLGTPDVRGTNSTFTYFSTAVTGEEAARGVAGGHLIQLTGDGPTYQASFDGPVGVKGRAKASVTFAVDPAAKSVTITLPKHSETVLEGQWSGWFDYQFDVTPKYNVAAIGRFYVISISPLSVFMYPPNIDPDKPWLPFTSPADYSSKLKQRFGMYKTIGWTHDTNALNSEKLDDKPWIDDMFQAMDKVAEIGLGVASQDDQSLFIWVETATDRVGHMFTRVTDKKSPRYDKKLVKALGGDPIEQTYVRMDEIVGRFMAAMKPDTTLIIMSDHGFHTYRHGLHTNAWLLENGYLTLLPEKERGEKANLFTAVDWSKTKAYSLGTGQIYVNLAGREGKGIVTRPEYDALVDEIAKKLEAVQDPKSKEKPVAKVYKRADIYKGERFDEAPDLQVAFNEGWRTSWETMLGGIPEGLFADNTKKWSGDHSASDVADTAGIFISNRKIQIDDPNIVDIAPTVMSIFDIPRASWMEGRDLFGGTLTRGAESGGAPTGVAPASTGGAAPAAPPSGATAPAAPPSGATAPAPAH